MKSNIRILTDIQIEQSPQWGEKTEYLKGVNPNNILITRMSQRMQAVLLPFLEWFQIVKQAKKYDVVITANIKAAQLFGLYKEIFRLQSPKHIVLELMLDEEKDTFMWKAKRIFQAKAFKGVDLIFVSSTREVESYSRRFGLPIDRVRFLPFHTDIVTPNIADSEEDYVLCAGKTGRDYATLTAAVKDLNMRFIIVSDKDSLNNVSIPPNVEVLYDAPYSKYIELLSHCKFVVVPLKKLVKSTGQVVILEAMGLGKPVITTRTTGTVDYIEHGSNGILVPPEDPETLKMEIVKLINNNELSKTLSNKALKEVLEDYTFDKYTSRILKAAYMIAGN
jgi:glycosyltransferase involved in cell wall biosynthesis